MAGGRDGTHYQIRVGTKTFFLAAAGLAKARRALVVGLAATAGRMLRLNEVHQREIADDYRAADVRNGFAQAVADARIIQVGRAKYPDDRIAGEAGSTVERPGAALRRKALGAIRAAMPETEAALNALTAEMRRFGQEMAGRAMAGAVSFGPTATLAFAVVGHVVAAELVPAEVLVQSGLAAVNSAAGELGSIKPRYFDDPAKSLSGKLAAKVGLEGAVLQRMPTDGFSSTGRETVKSVAGEVAGLTGKQAKSGRAPTREDFDEAMTKVLTTALTAGLLNRITRTRKTIAVRSRDTVEMSRFDRALKEILGRGGAVPDKARMKLRAEIWGKVQGQIVQDAANAAFREAKVVDSGRMPNAAEAFLPDKPAVHDTVSMTPSGRRRGMRCGGASSCRDRPTWADPARPPPR